MYTKADYFKDISKYDFKKYKVDVIESGNNFDDLSIKILFNGKVVYKLHKGTFTSKTVKDGKVVWNKWFFKYIPFDRKIVSWKDYKNLKKFNSWCGNYRVQNEVKSKLDIVLDRFARDLQ